MTRNFYPNIDSAWRSLVSRALRQQSAGSRDGAAREILGTQVVFPAALNWLGAPCRKLSKRYASAELVWYLSGTPSGDMIKHYAPGYARFLDDDGCAHGAYGYRWAKDEQLRRVIELLERDPGSRRAVITCFDQWTDLAHESPDIPCTISIQFFIRDNTLHAVTTMRSNDLWLGFPYDCWCFTMLQHMIAHALGVGVGTYTHQAGSSHVYERDVEKVSLAPYSEQRRDYRILDLKYAGYSGFTSLVDYLVRCESDYRGGSDGPCFGQGFFKEVLEPLRPKS